MLELMKGQRIRLRGLLIVRRSGRAVFGARGQGVMGRRKGLWELSVWFMGDWSELDVASHLPITHQI